jgi:hypothetical protein
MGLSSAASAADDELLPRSLSESWVPVDRGRERSGPGSPSWISMSATVGALLLDTSFDAVGTDLVERQVKGIGTGFLGLEGLIPVQRGWRVGVAGEADLWKDLRIFGGGPVVTYRMAASPSFYLERPDVEHLLKVGLLYQALEVTKGGFGRFDPTVTARVGYELRIAITPEWYLVGDAELRYGAWKYRGSTVSGDDRLGGVAGVLSFGIAWVP